MKKNHLYKFIFSILTLLTVVGFSQAVFASTIPEEYRPRNVPTISGGGQELSTEYDVTGAQLFIGNIISIILVVVGSLSVFQIISNAWWLIASGGKQETLDTRKKGLTWAILGLVFTLLSYIIIRFLIELPVLSFEEQPSVPESPPSSEYQLEEPSLTQPPAREPDLGDYELSPPNAEAPEGYLPDAPETRLREP